MIPLHIIKAFSFLVERDIEAYIVGGFLRDFLMGREAEDIDLAVRGNSRKIAADMAGYLGVKAIPLDIDRNIFRLVLESKDKPIKIDISHLAGKDIVADLFERDFTINALALSVSDFKIQNKIQENNLNLNFNLNAIIDPFQGRKDLESCLIRATNDKVFVKDPARLLRAFRLASEMDFSIDRETEKRISRDSHLVRDIAGERVREELLSIFCRHRTGERLEHMDSLGLLEGLFPELISSKGVTQPGWHTYDVFKHSIETVSAVELILQSTAGERQEKALLSSLYWDAEMEEHFNEEIASGSKRYGLNKLAGLLHDIAKPQTRTLTEDGRAHFYGHTKRGAGISHDIMEKLRFSNREIGLVEAIVSNHLRPTQMGDSVSVVPTKKAIYRFFRDTGDMSLDILYFSLADFLASKGDELEIKEWKENIDLIHYIFKTHREMQVVAKPTRLLNGHDLMKEFSLSPGPLVGELLQKIEEARALGHISAKDEALSMVRELLKERKA